MEPEIFSYTNLANLSLIEGLYENWQKDPSSVDVSWRNFFEGMRFVSSFPTFLEKPTAASPELKIYALITAYRTYGHLKAKFDPLSNQEPGPVTELNLENYGLGAKDLEEAFPTCGFLKESTAPLKEIIQALEKTYCHTIGIEYMGLGSSEMEKWMQERIEPFFDLRLTQEERITILKQLNQAEIFETFIHTKYVGQKRFSLEGEETLIPMLAMILETGGSEAVSDVTIGMSHRGRLNVLANIVGKSYAYIFQEFEDHYTPDLVESTGDVKYHKGFIGNFNQKVRVILSANPSHLESVDPVVEGEARALQEQKKAKEKRKEVLPILIHGDAALTGQGVVYETMQLSHLNGYGTEGTIHIVVNNQIGYTTLPKDGRSTRYCTDIAKSFGSPVFHVSAENPEECVAVAKIALQLRQRFGCDVFIDLNGYRKYGHNESDEPTFTQPLEYQLIRSKKTIRELYRDHLIRDQILDEKTVGSFEEEFRTHLNTALKEGKDLESGKKNPQPSSKEQNVFAVVETAVRLEILQELGKKICISPTGFNLHPKIQKLMKERLDMLAKEPSQSTLDWAMGELLAYATLSIQGIPIRLTGQDTRRGTFSHRHAIWVDQVNATKYFPLSHLKENQAVVDVFNSPLSEYACLGYEFGYSLLYPKAFVLWEAQFGDFNNGGQIIIDQYIASSEQKWGHTSSLTLLLPHGYEGQGPEHSSARLERFLQLSGENNMQVCNCTTPAQFFHLLRRQALRTLKKPLIIMTPKALLRHPECVSSLTDFSSGHFEEILDDLTPSSKTRKLIVCSGKIFYEIQAERKKRNISDMTILRIEQLYPFHIEKFKSLIEKYRGFQECIWVQEEHANMGAWEFLRSILQDCLGKIPLRYVGRPRAAAPAVGSHSLHKMQHTALIEELFKG